MKNTNGQSAETLKKNIDDASQKSKESIRTLIDTNSKLFDSAIEANKKNFDAISKILYDKEMDPAIVSSFKTNFGKSIKLSEDTIDSVIDVHRKRIDLSIDFVTKFMELTKAEDIGTKSGTDKLINLVKENFDRSTELSMQNMEKMVSLYNDHLNLVLNFNRKFSETMNEQIASMFKMHKKNLDPFFGIEMVNEWWKHAGEEKVKA